MIKAINLLWMLPLVATFGFILGALMANSDK